MLGTVTRGIGDTGALARVDATGQYVQLNAGALRTLPQRAVAAALSASAATVSQAVSADSRTPSVPPGG